VSYREKSKRLEELNPRLNPTKLITYQKEGTYPRSVLYFTRDRPALHPTQKPVALFSYLIKIYTNPGDLVLDNTIGSGNWWLFFDETPIRPLTDTEAAWVIWG